MKDYTIKNDKGKDIWVKNEKRVGYFTNSGNDEQYFYGFCFDWYEKEQRYVDGGTCYMSKKEFNENVKTFTEVF